MSRVQLALNVSDVDAAVDFYARLFGAEPAKRRPGYANFALADPPLKLVLIEHADGGGTLNHLGVEVATPDEVATTTGRLRDEGVATATEEGVTCCYAVQDKVWVNDPDGAPWEVYAVLADADDPSVESPAGGACGPGACATAERPADEGDAVVAACC